MDVAIFGYTSSAHRARQGNLFQSAPDPVDMSRFLVALLASLLPSTAWAATNCDHDGADYSYSESLSSTTRTISTNTCPNHANIQINPNYAVTDGDVDYTVPAYPMYNEAQQTSTTATGGAIGMAISASMIYSPYAGKGAGVSGYSDSAVYAEGHTFDECGGHASNTNGPSYHYHSPPSCLLKQLGLTSGSHSPQIGWMADGFPLYAVLGPGGTVMKTCTVTGGTYGTDICTDDCGGYKGDTGDGYMYRYYLQGKANDGTCCTLPRATDDYSADYYPQSPTCLNGCRPSGVSVNGWGLASGLPECDSGAEKGTTDSFTPTAKTALATNPHDCGSTDSSRCFVADVLSSGSNDFTTIVERAWGADKISNSCAECVHTDFAAAAAAASPSPKPPPSSPAPTPPPPSSPAPTPPPPSLPTPGSPPPASPSPKPPPSSPAPASPSPSPPSPGSPPPPSSPPPSPPSPGSPPPPSSPPPSSPPSPPPPDVVILSMTAAGAVNDFDTDKQEEMKTTISREAGVDISNVILEITAASVNILAYVSVPVDMAVATVESALQTSFATAAEASTLLSSSLLAVTVESEPQVAQASPPSSPSKKENAGIIAGATVGGTLLIVIVLAICYYSYRQSAPKGTSQTPSGGV